MKIYNTGIKHLGRKFKITYSGLVILEHETSRFGDVVCFLPQEVIKDVQSCWNTHNYFIDVDGDLIKKIRGKI